jgi:hypothetical protein
MLYKNLNPEKALIWRIIHRDNLPWVLAHGLHCGNSALRAPNWVSIGNSELIDKRARHAVPVPPGGLLNDYIPFYFTPFSVMMRNIRSGRGGVQQRSNDEIVILVSSLHHITKKGLPFLFTNTCLLPMGLVLRRFGSFRPGGLALVAGSGLPQR